MNQIDINFNYIVFGFQIAICLIFIPEVSLASTADRNAVEGTELYQKKNYNQASKKLMEAHQAKPKDPKISYNLGNSHYKQGEYEKAFQVYSSTSKHKIDLKMKQKATYNIGNTLYRMNKLEESVVAYKKALKIDPSDMDAKFNLEYVREQIKKKKQEQQKQNKFRGDEQDNQSPKNKNKNQEANNKLNKIKNKKTPNDTLSEKKSSTREKIEQSGLPARPETLHKNMSKEEAENKLSTLVEDLKKFQRKQALDMKSIFTYQGNDW